MQLCQMILNLLKNTNYRVLGSSANTNKIIMKQGYSATQGIGHRIRMNAS